MSKENATKTLAMFLAIALAVAGFLYARVNLGMSEQSFEDWMASATGTLTTVLGMLGIAVVALAIFRWRNR